MNDNFNLDMEQLLVSQHVKSVFQLNKSSFSDCPVEAQMEREGISSLKRGKAAGIDGTLRRICRMVCQRNFAIY